MEAQASHWNCKYASVEDCYTHCDGFTVLSILFQVRLTTGNSLMLFIDDCFEKLQVTSVSKNKDNPNFARLSRHLDEIQRPGLSTNLPEGSSN